MSRASAQAHLRLHGGGSALLSDAKRVAGVGAPLRTTERGRTSRKELLLLQKENTAQSKIYARPASSQLGDHSQRAQGALHDNSVRKGSADK